MLTNQLLSTHCVFLCLRGSILFYMRPWLDYHPFFFPSASLDYPPLLLFSQPQQQLQLTEMRLSPCGAAGVLMNSNGLLNEDLLKCCRLLVWHFRASGGVLNRCLCKCHSLTLAIWIGAIVGVGYRLREREWGLCGFNGWCVCVYIYTSLLLG